MADTEGWNPRPVLAALIDAGLISDTRNVHRVVIDIQGGQSPLVYVQYEGDDDKITGVVEQVAQSMPIVETSSAAGRDEPWTTAPTSLVELLGEADQTDNPYWPVPTHRESALAYARTMATHPAAEAFGDGPELHVTTPIAPAEDL